MPFGRKTATEELHRGTTEAGAPVWRESRFAEEPPRRKHYILRISVVVVAVLVVAIVVLAVGGSIWLKRDMRATLPQLDGQIHVTGLSTPVTVRRDEHGVPHIQAANLDDLFTAQGYVAAQDRLWQMDMARRMTSGDVSEILGSSYVKHDRMERVLLIRETAEKLVANFRPEGRRYFEDYAKGVNEY